MKKQWFFNDFCSSASRCRGSFRSPLRSPKGASRLPKMALRRPKMAPKRPKMAPRRPKTAQDGPRSRGEAAQDGTQTAPRGLPECPKHLRDVAREPFGSPRPQGASRPPQNEPRRWPQDGPICQNLMGNCCLLSSLCFPRRLGDSAAHFLIPTFVQRFAHNR